MRYVMQGASLVFGRNRLWPFVWKPMLVGGLIYFLMVAIGFATVPNLFVNLMRQTGLDQILPGDDALVARTIGAIAYGVVLWFASGVLFLTFTTIASAFLWEKLSIEVERERGVLDPVTFKHSVATVVLDGGLRFVLALAITILGILVGWACFGIIGILMAGWVAMHDYTCPAMMRRGKPLWKQMPLMPRQKGWFGFQVSCGLVTIVPLLNVLMLPAMVAGGTIMVSETEKAQK